GGDAEPPDHHRVVRRAGQGRLPPQRHLHLPAALRRLPRLRAGAHPGPRVRRPPLAAPRLEAARRADCASAAAQVPPRALRAVPALPVPRLLDPGEPEDGVQVQVRTDRGLHGRSLAPPRETGRGVSLYALARPLLFSLDPETSHHLTLRLSGLAGFAFAKVPSCP